MAFMAGSPSARMGIEDEIDVEQGEEKRERRLETWAGESRTGATPVSLQNETRLTRDPSSLPLPFEVYHQNAAVCLIRPHMRKD